MDIESIRNDFPELKQKVHNKNLIYFDNAATSLKPKPVIDAVKKFYSEFNSNVHRAGHFLSAKATKTYEEARAKVADFINTGTPEEIIFTKGTTDSINLLSYIFNGTILNEGDEIVLTVAEHHSNIVPWVDLKNKLGLKLKIIEIDNRGHLKIDNIEEIFTPNTKLLSIAHSSNVLGIINPVKELMRIAKKRGIVTVIDGAQSVVHSKVDVQDLGCDFYCFSGHKLYAPMGIGVLYGKKEFLDQLPPYQKGGGMIDHVSFEEISYNALPYKFEAGTPNVGGAIGLNAAIDYVNSVGMHNIISYEKELTGYAMSKMRNIAGIKFFGTSEDKDPIISFNIDGIHHYDLSTLLDGFGIALRSGHHCAQPLMKRLNVDGTLRASFAFYNTFEELDYFIEKINIASDMLR